MWRLFILVASLTAVSFGGGQTLMAGLERSLVQTGRLSHGDFAYAVALGQSTPGPLAAFTSAMGMAVGGFSGAVAATAGMLAVSLCAVVLIGWIPASWFKLEAVRSGLGAVTPYVTAVALFLGLRLLLSAGTPSLLGLAIAGGVAVAKLYKLPTAPVMITGVAAGLLLS